MCFYVLCKWWPLFCPLLTDYVEATGGSSEPISVMNKLGAVASSDTLDRHIMKVSIEHKLDGLLKHLFHSSPRAMPLCTQVHK